jgi:hypothetical protein
MKARRRHEGGVLKPDVCYSKSMINKNTLEVDL